MQKEIRFLNRIELRDAGDNSRHVTGYALVFNSLSEDLGFREIILPEALDGVIERSDILCLLNHNQDKGVLARSTNGQGSLTLTVDEKGLKYEFDAPLTALGDELLEGLRRGDIRNSSFGFTVEEDEWQETEDGEILRTIKRFDQLFDVSPVYHPAYSQTSVEARNKVQEFRNKSLSKNNIFDIDMLDEKDKEMWLRFQEFLKAEKRSEDSEDEEKDDEKEPETNSDECEKDEERDADTEKKEDDVEKSSEEEKEEKEPETDSDDEEEKEENSDEDSDEKDEKDDDSEDEKEDEERNKININIVHRNMKEKFSLIKTLNDMVEGRSFDESAKRVNELGQKEFRKSNIGIGKNSLSIPMIGAEKRDAFYATGNAKDVIPTDTLNLVDSLKARLILAQAGAHFMSGLTGNNIEIPFYTGSTCGWKQEGAKADRGEGEFKVKSLTPRRLTSVIHCSRQFLLQSDSIGAEEVIKKDLIDTLAVELEKTILGTGAGSAYEPTGLLYNVTPDSNPFTFADSILMETELEHGNVYSNNICYLASPSAKAILRSTPKDSANGASGQYIMEHNEVNGIPVYSSNVVADKGLILCDPSELWIAVFSGLNVTVDSTTLADEDTIRIVCNMYVDAITRRDEAFVKRILS